MARVTLGSGETITIGGNTDVFGTTGEQTINVLAGSTVNFRGGFNSGETDTIRIAGNASDFVVSAVGLTVTLFNAEDGTRIVLPIGSNGANIIFDNGDARTITREGNGTKIDDQLITATPVALSEGPGVYEVSSSGEVLEGGLIVFTVTRTDSSKAETLNVTTLGDTNGGSIAAATPGADYTVAGGQLTWAAGDTAPKTFTISAPLDATIEGLEGLVVRVLNAAGEVVATTSAVILDGTTAGQTFQLTSGLDTVGTGVPTDLVGSAGNSGTTGNDTIIAVTGEVNLLSPNLGLTGTITPFDNINGGAGTDTLVVLDNGNPFTSAPDFFGVTVDNVERLDYRAPTRGFDDGIFNVNTAGFDGLQSASFFINSGDQQTITLDDETTSTAANGVTPTDVNTSAVVTQLGNGNLRINGGGDTLDVTAAGGNVVVGQTTASNSFTDVEITGGRNITVNDQGDQELANVDLDGFLADFTLNGEEIATVSISALDAVDGNNNRNGFINTDTAVAVALSDIDVNNFDITSTSPELTINADGASIDISNGSDFTSAGNLIINSLNDEFAFGTAVANGNEGVVTLNAAPGSLSIAQVFGADLDAVNITGSGAVEIGIVFQDNDPDGTVITSTNSGGVTINAELGDNTQFAGALSSGDDVLTFGDTDRSNSFGAGDDIVTFNSDTFGSIANNGDTGSFDGGADYDILVMESNNAATFTEDEQDVSNFEELEISGQNIVGADFIDLANIGLDDVTNVTSFVGFNSAPEVTTLDFTGSPNANGADTVRIQGAFLDVTVTLADNATPAMIAAAVAAAIDADGEYDASVPPGGTVVTVVGLNGVDANLSVTFGDTLTPGTPTFEQVTGAPFVLNGGVAPVDGNPTVWRVNLDDITVLNGENLTLTIGAPVTITNASGSALTQNGGALATLLANALAGQPNVTATVDGNDLVITSVFEDDRSALPFTLTGTGIGPSDLFTLEVEAGNVEVIGVNETVFFELDGITTGTDSILFNDDNDPSTPAIEITFSASGLTPAQLAAEFIADYNANPARKFTASVPGVGEPFVGEPGGVKLTSLTQANVSNITAGSFTFVDDTSVGTPSVVVTEVQNGAFSSVTLDNFASGSFLELNGFAGNHTIILNDDTTADEFDLILNNIFDHGVVTAEGFESVTIDTTGDDDGFVDFVTLVDDELETLDINGVNGLILDTTSTVVTSVDASDLGGFFQWFAGPNEENIIVKVGSGGSFVDFSQMTIQGGNTVTNEEGNQTAPILFIGGSGDDFVFTGGDGTSRGTITTGAGNDTIFVGIVDGGLDNWSITDFDVKSDADDTEFDVLTFNNFSIFDEEVQELEPNATFQDYLDQAARGSVVGTIRYFYFEGDTYVVQDNGAGEDFQDGTDTVIRLEGEVELTADNFA